jgi:hypothetical protein
MRYHAQSERHYRRALEEFERVKALRPELQPKLPNEPISEDQPEQNAEITDLEPNPYLPPEPDPAPTPEPPPPSPVSKPASPLAAGQVPGGSCPQPATRTASPGLAPQPPTALNSPTTTKEIDQSTFSNRRLAPNRPRARLTLAPRNLRKRASRGRASRIGRKGGSIPVSSASHRPPRTERRPCVLARPSSVQHDRIAPSRIQSETSDNGRARANRLAPNQSSMNE